MSNQHDTPPPSAGRGIRRVPPITRLHYGQLGNPSGLQTQGYPSSNYDQRKESEVGHVQGSSPTQKTDKIFLEHRKGYDDDFASHEEDNLGHRSLSSPRAKNVASTASSLAVRLKENTLAANKKTAELDQQIIEKQDELAEATIALESAKQKLNILQNKNKDGTHDEEVEDHQLAMIPLQAKVDLLLKQETTLEKLVSQKKRLIEDEKSLQDEIIKEDEGYSGFDNNLDDRQEHLRKWVQESHNYKGDNSSEIVNVDVTPQTPAPKHEIPPVESDTISQLVTALGRAFGGERYPHSVVTKHVDKDLPSFDGKAEDWLTFKSEFDRTTQKYHYDDSENMVRLRKFVKGSARDSINHLLANPANVKKIMFTLQQRFGNPQFVVTTLIEKAKSLKSPDINKPESIVEYGTAVDALVTNVIAFKLEDYLNNIQLLTELVEKLPHTMRRDWYRWAATARVKENLESFQQWLETEVDTAIRSVKPKLHEEERKPERGRRSHGVHAALGNSDLCICCKKGNHGIHNCYHFKKMKIEERWNLVRDSKLCFRCLEIGHTSSSCTEAACDVEGCTRSHHRLLHKPNDRNREPQLNVPAENKQEHGHVIATAGNGALPMIYVNISGPRGTKRVLAMLDIGCSFTAVENDVASELGLTGAPKPFSFAVFGNKKHVEMNSRIVELGISSVQRNAQPHQLKNVRTVMKLGIPGSPMNLEDLKARYPYLRQVKAASIPNTKPKMVIGYDNYRLYNSRYSVEGPTEDSPSAYKSRLGWYVCGGKSGNTCNFACEGCAVENDRQLHQEMKDFFAVENTGVKPKPTRSKEDMRALELLDKHTRKINNSWETCLLWKDENAVLPDSKVMAQRRLYTMERKMDRDEDFCRKVIERFDDYLRKGYLVSADHYKGKLEPCPRKWFLPWFFAYHFTKKPRLVYDAASKANGNSLNDFLLKGPDLLNPLQSVLMRFREKKIALTGDIKEMFHQVKLREEDWPSQTILYRGKERNKPPQEYYMTVLFFGAASSPCAAIYVKNKNADMYQKQCPEAVSAIHRNFYMDDFLGSTDTEEEAIKLRRDITEIHLKGGFSVVKWNSNSKHVLESIPKELKAERELQLSGKVEPSFDKTLGMWWNPSSDEFQFRINLERIPFAVRSKERRPTKREVTSVIMSLFDPLGFLAPVKVKALIIIQNIWKSGISWDDEITPLLNEQWIQWLVELDFVKSIIIPRKMVTISYDVVDLHTFVDAGEDAYSCCLYLRFSSCKHKHVQQCFISGKARVAPIKGMTIPRMELEAALIGSRLASLVRMTLFPRININTTTFWSDSKTVLCWLRSQTGRFKMFVQTRIGEIQELTDTSNWRWVPTKENVADDATRPRNVHEFSSTSRWLAGVDFLLRDQRAWPIEQCQPNEVNSIDLEMREVAFGAIELDEIVALPTLSRFSSWMRLIWSTAAVLLAKRKFLKQQPSFITVDDIKRAEKMWQRQSQLDSFSEEMAALKHGNSLEKTSRLLPLSVYLNEDSVIVIRGRIGNAIGIQQTQKYPVVLSPKHPYTQLWIDWLHKISGHQGQERVISEIRKKAWILDCRSAVRRCWATCSKCNLRKLQPIPPEMGQLPVCRLAEIKQPFYHTGVDLFGPLQVKVNRSIQKRWGIIFTCMTIRAVYFDVVETLESGEVINALSRFISLRGTPRHIWSDNGTNFVGANRELRESMAVWNSDTLRRAAAVNGIDWHFNPPAAPHMGGSWERLIGLAKKIILSLLHCQAPRESVLRTVMAQAADIMNTRPLTYASVDPADSECLTPNHLLKMSNLNHAAVPGVFCDNDKYRRAWKYTQYLSDEFWRRWTSEYLPTLIKREKWVKTAEPLKIGDVVFLVDDTVTKSAWKKGIITSTYPGKDGQVRVVDVRVALGKIQGDSTPTFVVLRRPAVKVVPLGINSIVTKGHWEGGNVPAPPLVSGETGISSKENDEGEGTSLNTSV